MTKLNFNNRWVMVVGALGGIGRVVCRYLQSRTSCKFLLCDINSTELKKTAHTMQNSHTVEVLTVNLMNTTGQKDLFDAATKGRDIYAVVYAAGINFHGLSHTRYIELFNDIMTVNLLAPIHLIMLFKEYFNTHNKEGAILLFNSLAAKAYFPYQNIYSISKIALDRFIRSLIYENTHGLVTISQVYPGSVNTSMTTSSDIYNRLTKFQRTFITPPELVVEQAMAGFIKQKNYIYTKQFSSVFLRILSYLAEHRVAYFFARTYKKLL